MKTRLPSRNRLSTWISGTLKLAAAFAVVLAVVCAQDTGAATLTWTGSAGAASNVWDVGTTANWLNGGAPSIFTDNDAVTFDGIGSTNPVVDLTTTVLPTSVTVNSTKDYTFTNSNGGGLAGSSTLTKLGSGGLYLRRANTYTGGTTITAGYIQIFDANALGTGVLTLNSGQNGASGLWIGAKGAAGNGGRGVTNDIFMKANSLGNTLLAAALFSGKISGPGNWAWNGFSSGSVTLSGDNSGWSGGFNFYGPNIHTLYLGHTNALGRGTLTMEAGNLTVVSAAANLSGGLGVTNAIVMTGNPVTINLTNDLLLSGPISGGSNFVKSGSATLILGGTSPFTGGIMVSNGTLAVNGRLNGTGAVMVTSGATLGGTGAIAGPVTVFDGGTVNPGAGQLTLGNLTLSPDANLALTLGPPGNPTNSSLRVNGNLVLDGTVIISDSGGMSTGAVYSAINYTGTLTNNGCKVDPYSSWDMAVDTSLTNFVRLIATRKPPPWKSKNVVNVQSFGAIGDGLTDDTAAIQAALNYASARLGPTAVGRAGAAVVFPSGTYLVSDRLTFLTTNTLPNGQGLTIRGEGMTNTILQSVNETGSGLLYFHLQSPVLNSSFKLQIEDIGLQSARGTSLSGAAIEIAPQNTNTLNVWPIFRAVQISGCASDCGFNYGIKANRMNRSLMDRVAVNGQCNGSETMTAGFYYDYCYGPELRDCFVSGARTGMVLTNGGEGQVINRCVITNADTGIFVHVDPWHYILPSNFNGKVLNSVIYASSRGLYVVYKAYFTIANNMFARQGSAPGYVDITMEDVRNSFISENVFSGSESGRTGIKLVKLQFNGEYSTIAENSFGAFDAGVWLGTSLNSTRILANSNLPSSAVADYAHNTFCQPIYTNWLRSPHVSPTAAPGEELHPWEVFRDGRRIVNVADYGATGDGTTDDSAAVSSALNAFVAELNSDRSAGLYFPAGTYKLLQSLKGQFATTGRNAAIFGDGMNVSTIDWQGASFLELIDTGVSATAIDIHHLRITTPSATDDSVILSINQSASVATNRAFRAYDMSISTYRPSNGTSPRYGVGIAGVGLKNPLFRNVFVGNYENGLFTSNDGLYGSGLVLTNGIGFEAEYIRISNMTLGLNLHSAGGAIVFRNCHPISLPGDVNIDAGGGMVDLQGEHIDALNNLTISHASAVALADSFFLGRSTDNINSEEGTLRLTACTNVIVRNNEFGSVNTKINPQRFSIRLGEGCQNVEIAGNHFGEGIGIIIPAGAVNVRAFENRFLYPGGTDIMCQEPTAKILMLPGEDNPDLAAIWNLNEGAGTNVHGQCYGLDGVISGAAWVAGKYGAGLRFNGVNGSVTVVQYPEAFRYIATNFTIMVWVKPEKAIGGDETSGQSYALYPTTDVQPLGEPPSDHIGVGVSVGTNRIKVVERTGDTLTTSLDFTGTIPSSEWTHVAVAYSNSVPRLFINGVLQATGSASARIPHPGCWGGGSYGWYQGAMDDYRVYRRALSANEIIALGTAISKTWTGDGGANLWDINTSTNWVKTGDPLTPSIFNNNDAVVFDDLGSTNSTVTLTTTLLPASVTVNSAKDYTFTNSTGGSLGGTGGLTKSGSGVLRLLSANTYTGGTTISSVGGGIQLFDANALGAGVLTMNVGGLGGLTFGANVAAGNSGLGVTNDIVVLAASGNNALSFAGKLSGKISGPGNMQWSGFSSGSVTLGGDNSGWSGNFNFAGPITLYLGHTNALGRGTLGMNTVTLPVVSASADLSGGRGVTNAFVMKGNPVTINLTNDLLLSGPISGGSNFVKSGGATLVLSGNNTFTGNLTNSGGTLKAGNAAALGKGVLTMSGGTLGTVAAVALANNIVLAADGEIANTNDLSLSGVISGSAALIKTGSGMLTLSGNNSYTGGTTITAPPNTVLQLNSPGVCLFGSVTINSGRVLLGGNEQIADTAILAFGTNATGRLDLQGFNETIGGVLDFGGTGTRIVEAAVDLLGGKPASLTLNVFGAGAYNFGGYVRDAAGGAGSILSITKSGTGTQTFGAFSWQVSYSGPTIINAGVLEFSGANSVANNSAITINGGSLQFSGGGTRSNLISGAGNLTKAGANTLTLTGNNSYTGITTLSAGTLSIATLANGGVSSPIGASTSAATNLVFAGGTLSYSGATASLDRNFTINAATIGVVNVNSAATTLTLTGTTPTTNGTLRKTGAGTLALNSGVTTTLKGLVTTGGTNELKSGTIILSAGATAEGQFTNGFVNVGNFLLTDGTITATNGYPSYYIFTAGRQTDGSGVFTQNGGIFDGGNVQVLNAYGNNGTVNINGGTFICGQFRVAQAGTGTLSLNGGLLSVNNLTRQFANGPALVYFNGGTLQARVNHSKFIGDNAGANPTIIIKNKGAIIDTSTFEVTIPVALQADTGSTGGLAKLGKGTLTLANVNTYVGATTISNGTLLVSGSISNGNVAVLSAATLGGSGTINGPVAVNAGGTLTPGTNAIGKLTISNALTLAADSTTVMEINKSTGANDAVVGLTSVSYNGTLTVTNLGGTLAAGDSFKLFDAAGYSGSFAAIVPASPGAGLAWDASTLTSDGTLRVVAFCGVTILSQPVGRAAVVGSAVSFSVAAHTTTGVTNYQWRFEGLPIPGQTNWMLVLNSVQATNFGAYSVVVNNGECDSYSRTVQLAQAVSPAFLPVRLNMTTISMSFPTESGPTYAVEYKDTLKDPTWTLLNLLSGTGSTETVTDTTANSLARFYRIRVQ